MFELQKRINKLEQQLINNPDDVDTRLELMELIAIQEQDEPPKWI